MKRPAGVLFSLGLFSFGARALADEPTATPPQNAPANQSVADVATDDTNEVRVVGTPVAQTAGSIHVITSKKLERFEYDDPQAVLTSVPGVYGRGEDGVGLRPNIGMRGVNPDRSKKITLMEDGVLFGPAPYSAPAAYYFPLITRMTQVRVAKGVGSIVYGPNTIGGAIDLVTRPIPRVGSVGFADGALGAYGYRKLHGAFGAGNETMGFLLEGVHLGSDGFKHLPDGADTGFVRNEWMFKGRYTIAPGAKIKNELRLKVGYSDEISNETYVGLTDSDFRADPLRRYTGTALDRMAWHRTQIALTHVLQPSDAITVTTTAYRQDLSRVWRKVNAFRGASVFDVLRDPNAPRHAIYRELLAGRGSSASPNEYLLIGPNARDFVSQGVESRVQWQVSTGPIDHRVEYGLRLHYDRIERRHSEDAFQLDNGAIVPAGEPTVVTAFNEASTTALALYATDAMTWGPLTLTPGVRIEAIRSLYLDKSAKTETALPTQAVLPGAGAFFAITPSVGVLAGVHRGFSPPAPGSDPNVKPETSVNYEGGARFTHRGARLETIGFYNDYSNLTDVCTLSSGCVDRNLDRQFDAGSARIYGFEAFADYEIPATDSFKFPMTAAYTFTRGEFARSFVSEDPIFGNVTAGDEIPYVPAHQLTASVGVEHARAGGAIGVTYVSRMREIAGHTPIPETLATDEQFTMDASATARVFGPLALYVNVRNIFDAHYLVSRRPYGARPNAPRWVQVGAKVTF